MSDQRKSYTPEFKVKVVLESLQRDTTQEAACKQYGISSSMLHRWRKEFQTKAADIFVDKRDPYPEKAKRTVPNVLRDPEKIPEQ